MVLTTFEMAKQHFKDAIPYIGDRYRAGVGMASWKASAIAGEANYKTVMAKVITEERRKKGIEATNDEFWRSQAAELGAPVIGQRIERRLDYWGAQWEPLYKNVQETVRALPSSSVDWKENIRKRLEPVVQSWVEKRVVR